jgi:hypothetical protein
MLRIPNPVAYRCTNCGEPAVLVEFPTGLLPVHCGTYRQTCLAPPHIPTKSARHGQQPATTARYAMGLNPDNTLPPLSFGRSRLGRQSRLLRAGGSSLNDARAGFDNGKAAD